MAPNVRGGRYISSVPKIYFFRPEDLYVKSEMTDKTNHKPAESQKKYEFPLVYGYKRSGPQAMAVPGVNG